MGIGDKNENIDKIENENAVENLDKKDDDSETNIENCKNIQIKDKNENIDKIENENIVENLDKKDDDCETNIENCKDHQIEDKNENIVENLGNENLSLILDTP